MKPFSSPIKFLTIYGVFLILMLAGWVAIVEACRLSSTDIPSTTTFHKHIVGPCTAEERTALAISAEEVFQALKNGKNVELRGIVVVGDLILDRLPLYPVKDQSIASSRVRRALEEKGIEEVRMIPGSFTMQETLFQGIMATNLRKGTLLVGGVIDMSGTKFQKSVDFSRTFFLRSVNFSNSTIAYEGFFIGAYFDQEAIFVNTGFGTHSRFHKAVFGNKATFRRAKFEGLAEFLEVVFDRATNFSETSFREGTGFSGTQFRGALNFSQALFEREVYFRFTSFESSASFQNTIFKEESDFTGIEFNQVLDFTGAVFIVPPDVSGSGINLGNQRRGNLQDRTNQVVLFLGLLILGFFLVWGTRKRYG